MIETELALEITRFCLYAAAMYLWGAHIFLWTSTAEGVKDYVQQRLGGLNALAVCLLLLAVFASLPVHAADLGESWREALSLPYLTDVVSGTPFGPQWICQIILAAILLACLATRFRTPATALSSAGILASMTLTGHAAMHAGMREFAFRTNDIVHLLAVGAWFGALPPVFTILGMLQVSYLPNKATKAPMRFSRGGHLVVALVLLTGVVNAMAIVGPSLPDFDVAYQSLLAVKIGLAAVMVFLAIFNRYVLVPRNSIRSLRLGTIGEIALAIIVLGMVSAFGIMDPLAG